MSAQRAEGIRLLTDEAAAEHAGVHVETIWAWEAMGFLDAIATPAGPRYQLHQIRAVLAGATLPRPGRKTTAYRAAEMLGCSTATLRTYARQGLLYRDTRGRYDLDELEAFRAARAAPQTD